MKKLNNIAIIGSSGTIGGAILSLLHKNHPKANIFAISSANNKPIVKTNISYQHIEYGSEQSIQSVSDKLSQNLDLVLVTTGILHQKKISPEKSIQQVSRENMHVLFEANTVTPTLVAKYFLPKLKKQSQAIFAVLSARIGSISDNKLGGWYSYRASKAALNMVIKNLHLEVNRIQNSQIVVGIHPGTVASPLSAPFTKNLNSTQIFTPQFAATQISNIINNLSYNDSGKILAWNGEEILP